MQGEQVLDGKTRLSKCYANMPTSMQQFYTFKTSTGEIVTSIAKNADNIALINVLRHILVDANETEARKIAAVNEVKATFAATKDNLGAKFLHAMLTETLPQTYYRLSGVAVSKLTYFVMYLNGEITVEELQNLQPCAVATKPCQDPNQVFEPTALLATHAKCANYAATATTATGKNVLTKIRKDILLNANLSKQQRYEAITGGDYFAITNAAQLKETDQEFYNSYTELAIILRAEMLEEKFGYN